MAEAEVLKELRESLIITQKKFQMSHEEELKLESMADDTLHSLMTQVGIFQTFNLAIFTLLTTNTFPCSLIWLIGTIMCGLLLGLIVPCTLAYNKLKRLMIWVESLSMQKKEIDLEAGALIREHNSLRQRIGGGNEDVSEDDVSENDVPNENVPNENVPNENVPNENVPNENVPIEIVPNENVPNENVPNENGNVPNENGNVSAKIGKQMKSLKRMKNQRILMLEYGKHYRNQVIGITVCAIVYAALLPTVVFSYSCRESAQHRRN